MNALDRDRLAGVATVDVGAAEAMWQAALAPMSAPETPTLVSLLEDWSAFSGRTYPEMLTDVFAAKDKVDREWDEQRPQSAEDVAAFYDHTDTVIPLLLWWHATAAGPARCAAGAVAAFREIGARRVLDFGCGIGSTALALASAGFEVVLADVAQEAMRFAAWRLEQRGYAAKTIDVSGGGPIPIDSVDGVVSFDVFEHLPEVTQAVVRLDAVLAPGGVLCCNQAYVAEEGDEPQHYPQHGEVLVALHDRNYRLAHVPDVVWLAQKAPLPGRARAAQRAELRARIAITRALEPRRGRIGRRIATRGIRHALS
jgi:SAM-dependent methyltransferase